MRPPTRTAGREEMQVVAQIPSSTYDGALTVNLNNTTTAVDLGDVVQTPARASAVIPTMEGDLGELITRAVAAAMTPLDAQLKNVANRDYRDEKPGGHQLASSLKQVKSCEENVCLPPVRVCVCTPSLRSFLRAAMPASATEY